MCVCWGLWICVLLLLFYICVSLHISASLFPIPCLCLACSRTACRASPFPRLEPEILLRAKQDFMKIDSAADLE